MTPEQLERVRSSYESLGDSAPEMARDFYRRLFEADPSAETLFTYGPEVMCFKFAAELDTIVSAISSYDDFAPIVKDLAARHVGYGVQTHHYHAVGEALIGALAARLAPEWDTALEAAWRRAYNLIAEVMMAAAAEVRAQGVAGTRRRPQTLDDVEDGHRAE
jgi:hemoglobin-like flavoprotein